MKLTKILIASIFCVSLANADDVMKKSMAIMEKGMTNIQIGFLHNNEALIRDGLKQVKEGNAMFSDKEIISKYLPATKKHMANVAENQAKRITLDASVMDLNLDEKAFMRASSAYADILNACSRCHAIVREW